MLDQMGMPPHPPRPEGAPIDRVITDDAVVVVPGIMGSELYDTVDQRPIWGLQPGWYVRAWSPFVKKGLAPLAVTEQERAGTSTRVRATRLLRFPAFAPVLAGLEPYTPLVTAIKQMVRHPRAVREFAYDWRLSVAHNATLLARALHDHLTTWRTHHDRPDAQLVVVAHSMGGLLCQALPGIPGATDGIRAIITLGTPFAGAAKTAVILGSGSGAPIPLPAQRLRAVAVTMPGIYDLLPGYRCVDDGDTVRPLTPSDIVSLGANRDLADTANTDRDRRLRHGIPGHRALIGVEQPTVSSLALADGCATGLFHTFDVDALGDLVREPDTGRLVRRPGRGDGTVPRNASLPAAGVVHTPLAQQHATLAASREAITFVRDVLLHGRPDAGPRLGYGDVGLTLPDVVSPGIDWDADLTGIEPYHATVTVTNADTGQPITHAAGHRRDGRVVATVTLPEPGLYR